MTGRLVSLEGAAVGSPATLGVGIATCDAAEGLATINKPDMELVIWRRASLVHADLARANAADRGHRPHAIAALP